MEGRAGHKTKTMDGTWNLQCTQVRVELDRQEGPGTSRSAGPETSPCVFICSAMEGPVLDPWDPWTWGRDGSARVETIQVLLG